MPILHRLACFRDDVVFLVFLYQVMSLSRHHALQPVRLPVTPAMDLSY